MSNTELFMWRPELIDHLYKESEINLQQACINPIQDEVKNQTFRASAGGDLVTVEVKVVG
mgnify:CR=1 FL=1